MTDTHPAEIREAVRERYASAARAAARGAYDEARRLDAGAGPCRTGCGPTAADDDVFALALYGKEAQGVPRAAVEASLGSGIPTAVANLREGESVLDLGSGAGADVLISARRVGSRGRAIGLDMTDEMLELARANARDAGLDNVEFVKGYIEDIPLADASVDVVISNCVINLAADKDKVLGEAARVLRAGGRLAVSDVIADPDMGEATRRDMEQWTGCIAGALTRDEYERALGAAGLVDIEIAETHRVDEHASSAIVRARKPCGTTGKISAIDALLDPERLDDST
jgi:arsenite methyltransferase